MYFKIAADQLINQSNQPNQIILQMLFRELRILSFLNTSFLKPRTILLCYSYYYSTTHSTIKGSWLDEEPFKEC